jgi:hypothetical protein
LEIKGNMSTDMPSKLDDEDSDGADFHKGVDYKFASVYWRHGFSLPENGRIFLGSRTISFKGIIGTRLSFRLIDVAIEKASRMGGLVNDAFVITTVADGGRFQFSSVLKDRKDVIDKIELAIGNARKLEEEAEGVDTDLLAPGRVRTKFRMPPDQTLQKMEVIAERKIKGVSLHDYHKVAVGHLYVFRFSSD